MSDFVTSLRKKRATFVTEQSALSETMRKAQRRLADVTDAIAGIDSLLKLEGAAPEAEGPVPSAGAAPKQFGDMLLWLMGDRQPHSAEELAKAAAQHGADFEGKNPLRKINFTLLGIRKGGRVQQTADGRWQLASAQ